MDNPASGAATDLGISAAAFRSDPSSTVPLAAEGRCTRMELRDWLELARIELRREEGQTMTEYGILLALIAVVVIAALILLGPAIKSVFTSVTNSL
jgi:pilus assembly protein Flp/PilA